MGEILQFPVKNKAQHEEYTTREILAKLLGNDYEPNYDKADLLLLMLWYNNLRLIPIK